MSSVEDDLQPVSQDALLSPIFTLPEEFPEEPTEKEPSGPDDTSVFDIKHRDPFMGLLYLGKLSKEATIFGHSFYLETPTQAERLETGVIHKKYLNSLSTEIAWAAITVAAYLRKVDGSPLPEPIGPSDTGIVDRFNWVIDNLKGPVIALVYEECLILDSQVSDALEELKKVGEG